MKINIFSSGGRKAQTRHTLGLPGATISWSALTIAAGALLLTQQTARAFSSEDLLAGPFHHEGITERAAYQSPIGIVRQGSSSSRTSSGIIVDKVTPNSQIGAEASRQSTRQRRVLPRSGAQIGGGPLLDRPNRPYEKPETSGSSGRGSSGAGPLVPGARKTIPRLPDWNFEGALRDETSLDPARTDALNTLGWHADYIDSYLYSPLWWAQGWPNITRFKSSLATSSELEKLHFDDLFTTEQVD